MERNYTPNLHLVTTPPPCAVFFMPAEIVDVHSIGSRNGPNLTDISDEILEGLAQPFNRKQLPTVLLYDERGLRLYDDITTEASEYYLFGAEEEILKNKADEIVCAMHAGARLSPDEVIVELGAGTLRKTSHVLLGLSRLVDQAKLSSPITYYALDLEQRELQRVLDGIEQSNVGSELQGKVKARGMCGTYDDGLKFIEEGGLVSQRTTQTLRTSLERYKATPGAGLSPILSVGSTSSASDHTGSDHDDSDSSSPPSTPEDHQPPLHIMFLGSSLGNFSRDGAADFLRSLPLKPGMGDTLLLGLDHDNDKELIEEAYNDPKGRTKKFIFNGLKAAGRALGDENMFDQTNWEYLNRYDVNERRHEAFFKSKCVQTIIDPIQQRPVTVLENELVKIEESLKFSDTDAYTMFAKANLRPVQRWRDEKDHYSLWLLERPPFILPSLSSIPDAPFGLPTKADWLNMWAVWDHITQGMIPAPMLYQKPIDLRHICLFYLGHIPTFLDIHLSKLLGEPHTKPEHFKLIFERGIDPNVDDPTECHPHSEVPVNDEDWPSQPSILAFQKAVRARLFKLYDDVDSGKVLLTRKIGRVLFMTLEHEAMHAETLLYMLLQRAGTGTLPPADFIPPSWSSLAQAWNSAAAPAETTVILGPETITLGHDDREGDDDQLLRANDEHEFGWDNENPRLEVNVKQFQISWRPITNGDFFRFLVGAGKGKVDFPASWVLEDGKVKVRTLYGPIPLEYAQHWPIMTSYENLSAYAIVKGGRLPTEPELRLFFDKFEAGYDGGANVGFRNWHPIPATTGLDGARGKGTNGGVWEWTSTAFDGADGFVPSGLYPGYSMDFFDGKHNVVLGGSFATIPRISERRSFRNWYQRNYPYAWVGGRVAYDLPQ